MTTDVNSQINDQEAVGAVLEYITDPDKPLEERFALLLGLVKVHVAEIAKLKEFRRRSCKVAWALAMPGATGGNHTGFPDGVGAGHIHEILNQDARNALADQAALDTSGYGPQPVDPEPYFADDGGSLPEHSVGAGLRRKLPLVHGARPS